MQEHKVIHIIYSGLGGHAAMLFSLLENGFLPDASHHVILAGVEAPLKEYIDRLDGLGISWTYVGKPPGKGHFRFYFELLQEVKRIAPDYLFLNGLAATPTVPLLRVSKAGKIPKIVLRESEPVQLKSNYEWFLLALAHLSVDAIIHLTPEAVASAKAKLRLMHSSRKVNVISNGLDTNFFSASNFAISMNESEFHIGMISRLQHKKDHATLIKALRLLKSSCTDTKYHLHIAGDGASKEIIEQLIRDHDLTNSVTMHGMLDVTQVRNLLASLDLYVHSTFGETMSNSIMQAMSMGLPIIASNVQGVNNMVDGRNGLLFNESDSLDLYEKIQSLRKDPNRRDLLGKAAREYAIENFSIKNTARHYECIFKSL